MLYFIYVYFLSTHARTGRDALVPRTGATSAIIRLRRRRRHVVCRLHLCRDGDAGNPSFPRREIDQAFKIFRLLATPNEEVWPGVTQLPDYEPTFPQWPKQSIACLVPHLEESGMDLLSRTLTYDPEQSVSFGIHISQTTSPHLDQLLDGIHNQKFIKECRHSRSQYLIPLLSNTTSVSIFP